MNRIEKEWLAIRKSAGIYLRYRKNPIEFSDEWMLEKKGKEYIDWFIHERSRLLKFRNIHEGEDCFIIGNGPSLNKMDLKPLNKFYLFGLNKIYLIFNRVPLNLTYYVSVNKYVVEQSSDNFPSIKCPIFLSYHYSSQIGTHNKNIFKVYNSNPRTFTGDITGPIWGGATVTFAAMQIAYFMGFHRIFLIGVDHNFKAEGKPHELQIFKGNDVNHFDPNYFKDQQWQLPDLESSELAFHHAKFHFARSNRKIYDATVGGKLNIFEKIPYKTALQICKMKKD